MIEKIEKYKADTAQWQTFNTADEAKQCARRQVVEKFLDDGRSPQFAAWDYYQKSPIYSETKTDILRKQGFEQGVSRARQNTIDRFLRFYTEIQTQLKTIDQEEVK